MRNFLLLFSSLFLANAINLQGQTTWAKMLSNGLTFFASAGTSTCRTPDGGVLTVGVYNDSIDFDPGMGEYMLGNNSTSYGATFLVKLDANGDFVWAGTTSEGIDMSAKKVQVDNDGNVYVLGYFRGEVDFDPGPGEFLLNSANMHGNGVGFLMKLDSNLNFLWAKKFGAAPTSASICYADDMAIDAENNLYLFGTYFQTFQFDNNTWVQSTRHGFLIKINENGVFQWFRKIGFDNQTVYGNRINIAPDGGFVCTGYFEGTPDFDPGTDFVAPLTSVGDEYDCYILKLDANGNFEWVKGFHGPDHDFVTATKLDSAGNIYVGGKFNEYLKFTLADSLVAVGGTNVFLAKLSPTGEYIWSASIPANSNVDVFTIEIAPWGDVYYGGRFKGNIDVDFSASNYPLQGVSSSWRSFVVHINGNGELVWASKFGAYSNNWVNDLDIASDGSIIATGVSGKGNDFQFGDQVFSLSSSYIEGIFILRGFDCPPMSSEITLFACPSATYNGVTYDTVGIYQQILSGTYGCDSSIVINVLPHQPDTSLISAIFCQEFEYGGTTYTTGGTYEQVELDSIGCPNLVVLELTQAIATVTVQGDSLLLAASSPNGTAFQWVDCNTLLPIPGATMEAFIPTETGSYAVTVQTPACEATSECIDFIVLPTAERWQEQLRVFPQPFHDQFHVELSDSNAPVHYQLFTLEGKLVDEGAFIHKMDRQLPQAVASSIYTLKIWQEKHPPAYFKMMRI